jgi:hypothetical protein
VRVTQEDDKQAPECIPARLFALLWETLDDVIGSAATATVMRRAVKRASTGTLPLEGLAIVRERFEYRYAVPESWNVQSSEGLTSLRGLTRQLHPLLVELTGLVVVHRLRSVPELVRCGLFHAEVEA